jgi:LmbE family N-acetylglucosaminyl deacetylase
MNLGTVLGVWAHPDDETYLLAGIMADSIRKGQRVMCVTATRGEEGSWDEERWPTSEMGKVREAELEESLRILGVNEHIWLDYYDGTCASVPTKEGVSRVAKILEDVKADSVFTFGPDGMTDHSDHKAVCAWTTEAFERVAKAGATLYYATQTAEWAEEFVPRLQKFNTFRPGTPPITPIDELAVNFELGPDLLELKLKAIEAHTSQVEGMLKAFGEDFFRSGMKAEFYRLAKEK